MLRQHLAPDHLYVMDRWYAEFKLFNDIVAASSSYVCRVRDNSRFQVLEERPLTDAARGANVTFDAIVETLLEERRIELRNFGVFEVKKRKARKARNPRTNEPIKIRAAKVPKFRAGKALKDALN